MYRNIIMTINLNFTHIFCGLYVHKSRASDIIMASSTDYRFYDKHDITIK